MLHNVFMNKHFIQPNDLLEDSFNLAWKIYDSNFRPNFIIGVWRGGAPIGIAVQEFLDVLGVHSDHIAIRTSYYSGIDKRKKSVEVFGLNYVLKKVKSSDTLLIVDDVFDTGLSIDKVISEIKNSCKKNCPDIKVASPYFKPLNNQTDRVPDYYLHETTDWLVFPHELQGLSIDEISDFKPQLSTLIDKIKPLI